MSARWILVHDLLFETDTCASSKRSNKTFRRYFGKTWAKVPKKTLLKKAEGLSGRLQRVIKLRGGDVDNEKRCCPRSFSSPCRTFPHAHIHTTYRLRPNDVLPLAHSMQAVSYQQTHRPTIPHSRRHNTYGSSSF